MTATATVSTFCVLGQLLDGLSEQQLEVAASFIRDVVEAAKMDNCLNRVSRDKFRQDLYLPRLLPEPTITPLDDVVLPAKTVPVSERIAAGDYKGGVNSDITDDLIKVTLGAGPAPLVLADFGVDVTSEEVDQWCQADGRYEVAYHEDGLAVGATPKHQHLQLKAPIVVLGGPPAVLGGGRLVLYLSRWGGERGLSLDCYGHRWSGGCRFLLRKVSQPLGS